MHVISHIDHRTLIRPVVVVSVLSLSCLCCVGDEIEPADGDPSEVYRILFDITFFFFVIVILLAIIQGESSTIYSRLSVITKCYLLGEIIMHQTRN